MRREEEEDHNFFEGRIDYVPLKKNWQCKLETKLIKYSGENDSCS